MEDQNGIVYCTGREASPGQYEATATYLACPEELATKWSIADGKTYRRVMYQGADDERSKLDGLPSRAAEILLSKAFNPQACLRIGATALRPNNPNFAKISYWQDVRDQRTEQFCKSLERACELLDPTLIEINSLSLYGGAAFGLLAAGGKPVEDIDLLSHGPNNNVLGQVRELMTPFTWSDINPFNNLTPRRQRFKAKRWSTSQIRMLGDDFLSIDFKQARDAGASSLWDELPDTVDGEPFVGKMQVVDDSETFCISPAFRCEDKKGDIRTVLCSGYAYIGTAVAGDIITVLGSRIKDTGCIVVTQAQQHDLLPDFSNVPVS